MQLRPHHILDIIRAYGNGHTYTAHPYGHSQHLVAEKILSDLDTEVKLVIGADSICVGCKHLQADGRCTDVLAQLSPSISKQEYNDKLDQKLFEYLGLEANSTSTVRGFLVHVNQFVPGIEEICTHPGEDKAFRLNGLINGLLRLGIR